jgi:peptide/nickel transport system substrate-binding protein
MQRTWQAVAVIVGLACSTAFCQGALAQKTGGILKATHRDSPASLSIHEEGTYSVIAPMMGAFNNLVLYDQHVPQNSLATPYSPLIETQSVRRREAYYDLRRVRGRNYLVGGI